MEKKEIKGFIRSPSSMTSQPVDRQPKKAINRERKRKNGQFSALTGFKLKTSFRRYRRDFILHVQRNIDQSKKKPMASTFCPFRLVRNIFHAYLV